MMFSYSLGSPFIFLSRKCYFTQLSSSMNKDGALTGLRRSSWHVDENSFSVVWFVLRRLRLRSKRRWLLRLTNVEFSLWSFEYQREGLYEGIWNQCWSFCQGSDTTLLLFQQSTIRSLDICINSYKPSVEGLTLIEIHQGEHFSWKTYESSTPHMSHKSPCKDHRWIATTRSNSVAKKMIVTVI